jgi:thymidylate synthase
MSIKNALIELRFFMQGLRDKRWLQERGNHFWDKWSSPPPHPTHDLGPIYGVQWRNFNGIDQLAGAIQTLKTEPLSRRMLVSAWNPNDIRFMALPPCHDSFQFLSNGKDLDLIWRQRSCDIVVGLPYDVLLYGLMLELVAKEVKMKPRWLIGQLGSVHIYEQNMQVALEMLDRVPKILPELKLPDYTMNEIIKLDSAAGLVTLSKYEAHPAIKVEVVA